MKTVKYVMTNGLMANHLTFKRPKLVKVLFDIKEDDSVVVTVISGHNGGQIDSCGKKTITREELRNIPEDPYNDMVFNRAAFEMMGLEI